MHRLIQVCLFILSQFDSINFLACFFTKINICAHSAVDNVIFKIIESRFVDGNGGKYSPSVIRVGNGQSASVIDVSLDERVEAIVGESSNMEILATTVHGELSVLHASCLGRHKIKF